MMNLTARSIGIGALAGLASALLAIGVASESGLAIALYFLAPLPIFIAALGWGLAGALAAGAIAALSVGAIADPMTGFIMAVGTAAPSIATSWLATRAGAEEATPAGLGRLTYIPLSRLLVLLTLMAAAAIIVIGLAVDFGPALAHDLGQAMIAMLKHDDPGLGLDARTAERLQRFLVTFLPVSSAAIMVVTLAGNFYLGLRLTALSDKLARPRDDWPTQLRMPASAAALFIVMIGLSFMPGGAGHAAAAVAGALGAGFMLAGFAAFHFRTRGRSWRTPGLALAYVATALFGVVALFFVIAGLIEALPLKGTRSGGPRN